MVFQRLHPFSIGRVCLLAVVACGTIVPVARSAEDAQSYVADAKKDIESGNLRAAEIQLRNAVRLSPSDPSIHVQLAEIYLKLDNLPAAEAEARAARQNKGPEDEVGPVLAEALAQQGKFTALFQLVQPGNRAAKSEAAVRLTLGSAHLTLGELDDAEPLLREAVRLDEQAVASKVALARLLLGRQDFAGADAELAKGLAIAPNDRMGLRLKGDILIARQDVAGAMEAFGMLLAKYPDDIGGLLDRADQEIRQSKLADAQQDIDHALKIAPKSTGGIYLRAFLLAKKGEMKQAEDVITQISASFGTFPSGYYLQGAIENALGQYEQAYANFSKFIARNPNEPTARRLAATIALRRRDNASVIQLLGPVVDANPSDAEGVSLLAQAYVATGRKNLALELYQHAADAQPSDDFAQARLAVEYVQTGDVVKGMKDLEKIAQADRGAPIAGPLVVLTDLRMGKVSAAAAEASALVKRNANDSIAQNLLGVVRIVQQDYPAAVNILKPVVQREPNLLQAQRNLAQAYIGMQQPEEAKKVLQEVLKRHPADMASLVSLAQIAVSAKDYGGAVDALDKAQQAAPKDPTPGIQKLQVYQSLKKWDEMKVLAKDLEGRFPANQAVLAAIAQARLASGDPAGAVAEYRRLVEANPKSDTPLLQLADAQIRMGDGKGARESLQSAIETAPSDARPMATLVALDLREKGVDAALATARSFSKNQPVGSPILAAGVLVGAKRSDEAIALLQQAQQSHPDTAIIARLAELTYQNGKPEEARSMLEAWTKVHDDPAALHALGIVYLLQNDLDKAQGLYERLHDLAPTSVPVLFNLAWIYAKKHDPRAHDLAEQGYFLAPTAENADNFGWILTMDGDAKDGLAYLTQASAALPQNMKVRYHLAAALNASGKSSEARAALASVVNSDTVFDEKDDARRLFEQLKSN